jgi:hypothetical protein
MTMPRSRVWLLALILAACGGASQRPGEEMIGPMTALRDEMCACKDRECADRVKKKHDALEEEGRVKYGEVSALPKDVLDQLIALDAQLRACKSRHEPEP